MLGSGAWRLCAFIVVSLFTCAPAPARAAGPQPDPLDPPAVSVTEMGRWAAGNRHPADGDALAVRPGTWSGLGNTFAYQWQRCETTAPSSCADLPGRTSTTLVPDSLFGVRLRAAVTATNPQGSTTAYTAMTAVLADELPHRIDPADGPVLAGTPKEGERLTIDGLRKFTGSRPLAYHGFAQPMMVWRRYADSWSERWTAIANESDSYVLQASDVGKYVAVVFTLRNGAGNDSGDYTIFDRVGPIQPNTDPPAVVAEPEIGGDAVDGGVLQGARGTWTGGAPLSHAYQWQRCDGDGGCSELPGETTSRYTAGPADVGTRLRLRVTATNPYGEAAATSAPTPVISAAPPALLQAPQVSGTARDGQVLTGAAGTFSGTQPIAHGFGWERCDQDGNACEAVAGATAPSYTLTPADIAHRMRYRQTATNAGGSASARSAATAVVQAIAPAARELPAISGPARDEARLTGTPGAWTGSPEIAYARQWLRCAAVDDPAGCNPIAGATGEVYDTVSADVGSFLRLRVTASNFGNATDALSEATAAIAAVAPRMTAAPTVSGDAVDGAVLTLARGTWAGTMPQTYAQRWERCDPAGAACDPIDGATSGTYRLTGEDVGHRVRAVVLASGRGGDAEAASGTSDVIAAVPPSNTERPELSGTARDGETLTATEGAWSGSVPMTRSLRWERCDAQGEACAAIPGATGATLVLSPADVGGRVRVRVLASNAAGERSAVSGPSAVVAAVAPASTRSPAIEGTARDGQTVTVSDGTWTGSAPIMHARQWLRCASAEDAGGCEPIPGATARDHRVVGDDVGSFLRVRVTARNAGGEAVAWSAAAGGGPVAAAPPVPLGGAGPVTVIHEPGGSRDADQSAPDVGDRVVAEPGTWSGTDRPGHRIAYAYAWERCGVAGCVPVPGRTAAEMSVTEEDLDAQLRAVVTATSPAGGQSQATSRLGVTRGSRPAAVGSPVPVTAAGPLALPAGSLLAPGSCQRVGRRVLSVRAGRAGRVRVVVPAGAASSLQPLPVTVKVARPKALRKLTLKVGGKRVRLQRGGRGVLRPAQLAGSPQLSLVAVPRSGRPARASGRLATRECDALLTVVLRGRRLLLRIDQRPAFERAAFTLPKGLGVKLSGGRVGSVETLRFGSPGKHVAPARVGENVALAGRTLTLSSLPVGTAAATLTTTLAGKVRRGRMLRFVAATGATRTTASITIRR